MLIPSVLEASVGLSKSPIREKAISSLFFLACATCLGSESLVHFLLEVLPDMILMLFGQRIMGLLRHVYLMWTELRRAFHLSLKSYWSTRERVLHP
jgi:hypothetical protein